MLTTWTYTKRTKSNSNTGQKHNNSTKRTALQEPWSFSGSNNGSFM